MAKPKKKTKPEAKPKLTVHDLTVGLRSRLPVKEKSEMTQPTLGDFFIGDIVTFCGPRKPGNVEPGSTAEVLEVKPNGLLFIVQVITGLKAGIVLIVRRSDLHDPPLK